MGIRRSFAVLAILATALAIVPAHASHQQDCRPLLLFGPIFGQGEECPGHPEPPREPVPISGNAFGVHVRNLRVLGTPVGTPPPLPSVTLPPAGGSLTANLAGGTFGPVTADVLRVNTEGDLFQQSYSLSSAYVARVGISVGALSIEATAVQAVAYCHGHGPDDRGPVGFDGQPVDPATLGSLTIDIGSGPVTISALPLPNTWIPIPGIGGIMLREQWNLGDAWYQHFTENMIHVYLLGGPVTGEIIISSAHCDGFMYGKKVVEQDRHGERIEIEF